MDQGDTVRASESGASAGTWSVGPGFKWPQRGRVQKIWCVYFHPFPTRGRLPASQGCPGAGGEVRVATPSVGPGR
jgi:hypothetical protein